MYELSLHKGEDFRTRSRYTISFISYIIHTIILVELNNYAKFSGDCRIIQIYFTL